MPARSDPVCYDVSFRSVGDHFRVDIREDDEITSFRRDSFEEAKRMADCLPDYGSWPDIPWSVFYPGGC